MTVTVRLARTTDAPAIARALREAPQIDDPPTEHEVRERVARATARAGDHGDRTGTLLVAELDGAVVAYAHVHWVPMLFLAGPEGYITELFVVEEARGRGCGRALLDEVGVRAKKAGASRLSLFNGRESDAYARAFYPKHGFTEAGHLATFRRHLGAGVGPTEAAQVPGPCWGNEAGDGPGDRDDGGGGQ